MTLKIYVEHRKFLALDIEGKGQPNRPRTQKVHCAGPTLTKDQNLLLVIGMYGRVLYVLLTKFKAVWDCISGLISHLLSK